jgi:CRP-like cAMP-binding protein/RsiW-degrading membrane proteinase PrsW (M82 family)
MLDAEQQREARALLRAAPPFDTLDASELDEAVAALHPERFATGETIFSEGEPADRWYVIADGTARVTRRDLIDEPVTLAVLGPGAAFGERALARDTQLRSATITALTEVDAFSLTRRDFASPSFHEHLEKRLQAIAVDTALKRASPFSSLHASVLQRLVESMEYQCANAGEAIVRQGDIGDCLYVITSGTVEVTSDRRHIARLGEGDAFGEVAVLSRSTRTATVRALESTGLLVLRRATFEAVVHENAAVAAHFRELVSARFQGGQRFLLPDPVSTIMPLASAQRRRRYWLVLLVGILLFMLLSGAASVIPSAWAKYAVMMVGSLIGPIVFVQYLAESNILSERALELVATAALAATLGLPAATWLQHAAGLSPGSFPAATLIAAIEEPAKLLGVVWLLRIPALRFRMDGVIFGAAAGMGFAAIETGMYALARIDTFGAFVGVLWARALLSPFTHGTWTAIVCATLWRERAAGWRGGGWKIGGALAGAILLHALWDWQAVPFPANVVWMLLVGATSIVGLRAILQQAAAEEARSVAALAPQVGVARGHAPSFRCDGCGRLAPAGARYCPRCGRALRSRLAS